MSHPLLLHPYTVYPSLRYANFGSYGKLKKLDAYDVVMTGSSCGDIFAALGSLPGVQKVGENGRLYVRGGDNFESQVFINGMHVLNPYDEEPSNTVTRSRFSPFLFKGINFSLGGYAGEYGQALSSILPMETTDVSSCDKLGVNISPLSAAVGGTKAFTTSSLSFNTEFMNLGLYNKMFPDRYDCKKTLSEDYHRNAMEERVHAVHHFQVVCKL